MNYCALGKTGINVSKIGFGTGTTSFTGINLHSSMSVQELSGLLLYAYELGINLWDTAYTYETYPHIQKALESVGRDHIIISSKTDKSGYKDALVEVENSLRFLRTDYIDIFLLHGVRNAFDFRVRRGALKALVEAKKRGLIRAIGFSSHGIGAIEAAQDMSELDVIMARVNFSGDYMDSYQENIISNVMSIPIAKKIAKTFIPKSLIPSVSKLVEPPKPPVSLRSKTQDILRSLHESGKGIIGIKLFGAGKLKSEANNAISFAKTLSFVDSFVIGMAKRNEIMENINLYYRGGK